MEEKARIVKRKIHQLSSKLEFITPEKALSWLSNNPNNRPINEKLVNELCQKIRSKKWTEKGGAIEVFYTGRLINGQHRLTAIVRTGIPVKIKVRTFTSSIKI